MVVGLVAIHNNKLTVILLQKLFVSWWCILMGLCRKNNKGKTTHVICKLFTYYVVYQLSLNLKHLRRKWFFVLVKFVTDAVCIIVFPIKLLSHSIKASSLSSEVPNYILFYLSTMSEFELLMEMSSSLALPFSDHDICHDICRESLSQQPSVVLAWDVVQDHIIRLRTYGLNWIFHFTSQQHVVPWSTRYPVSSWPIY